MAYALTLILACFTVLQPGVLWAGSVGQYRPFMLLAAAAILTWLLSPLNPRPSPQKPTVSYSIILLVAAQSISEIQYLDIPWWWQITQEWLKIGLIYFLVVSQVNSLKRLNTLWAFIGVGVLVLSIQAVWTYHTASSLHFQLRGGRLASYGQYSGANDLALLTVCFWPILFKFIDMGRNILLKLLPVPLLILLIYINMRTLSRAGMIGLVLVIGLSLMRSRSLGRMGRWVILVPAVIVMIMVGSQMVMTRGDLEGLGGQDESMMLRFGAWKAGVAMFVHSPLYGIGSDNFYAFSSEFGSKSRIEAHNTIIKVAAESGILGLVGYLGVIIGAFLSLKRSWRGFARIAPRGSQLLWAEALGIALIGFFFNTQFSVKAQEWMLYFIVAGAVVLERIYYKDLALFLLKAQALKADAGTETA